MWYKACCDIAAGPYRGRRCWILAERRGVGSVSRWPLSSLQSSESCDYDISGALLAFGVGM